MRAGSCSVLLALPLLAGVAATVACSPSDGGGPTTYLGENAAGVTEVDGGRPDAAAPLALAEKLYREIEPQLVANCGAKCHGTGALEGAPPWMKAPAYDTIRGYPGIVLGDVYSSKLLIKPNHLGLSLLDKSLVDLREKVVKWLTAEAQALDDSALPTTAAFAVGAGRNDVDLSVANKAAAGARLRFEAEIHSVEGSSILQLKNVEIVGAAATKLKVVHPLFLIVPEEKDAPMRRDPTDQFSTVDQTLAPAEAAPLGPGAATIVSFPPKAQLKVRFEKLEPPAALGAARACKAAAAFSQNAAKAITDNGCLACHGGADKAAVGAVDMSKLGTDDAAACAQLLTRVNMTNKKDSPLILAPTSGNTRNHGGGKNIPPTSDFVTKILAWAELE